MRTVRAERTGRGGCTGGGAADNKGQVLIHMVVAEALSKQRRLRSNVVFLIEGEEETGSRPLRAWLQQGGGPPADELLISDGCYPRDRPPIERSLRGGFNGRIRITTARNDAHSGHAGGAIANAASVLANVIAALVDARGVVTVPGFCDAVPDLSDHTDDPKTVAALLSRFQVSELVLANAASYATQVSRYPTLQVSGIHAGYIDEYANIVPATAVANLNGRLVAGQNPDEV